MGMEGSNDGLPTLARRLNKLFDLYRDENGNQLNNSTAAEKINDLARVAAQSGGDPWERPESITSQTISNIRLGKVTQVTVGRLIGLAMAFEQDLAYFLPGAKGDEIDENLELVRAMRDADVRNIALRAHSDLEPEDRSAVKTMIEALARSRRRGGNRTDDKDDGR